jgi:uncharacterized membrane protein
MARERRHRSGGAFAGARQLQQRPIGQSAGEIAGNSENGVIDPVTDVNEVHAVLWKNGEIEDLGTLGGNNTLANPINSRGQIVGTVLNGIADGFSIYYLQFFGSSNGTQSRAFLWQDGDMKDLGT